MRYIGIGCVVVIVVCLLIGGCSGISVISTMNKDATLKNRVSAQVEVRNAHFDKMFKVIANRTQIAKASSEVQVQLVDALVKGRSATFIKIVQEQNPDKAFDRAQFTELANSVEAQREDFFREQKQLIDLVREHHILHDSFPGGLVLGFLGRSKVDKPLIITSERAEEAAATGKDNEVDLDL
jgi:hypothetical protein